jgi:8-oxo-dGTP pyrophosphatase MutT (NUDIX family)
MSSPRPWNAVSLDHLPARLSLHRQAVHWQDADAAVLLLLRDDPSTPSLLLTRRASHLRRHAGEIAFPGGKRDPGDVDLVDTALREAEEEIGLARGRVDILGGLTTFTSRFGQKVAPVVARLTAPMAWQPAEAEIDTVFEVPLPWLADCRHLQLEALPPDSGRRFPYVFQFGEHRIWGLTAAIIVEFLAVGLEHDFRQPPALGA